MESRGIIFVWTSASKESVAIKNIIEKSPFANVIGLACADDPRISNRLLYGKNPCAIVPIFIVVNNGEPTFYQLKDEKKVMNMALELLEGLAQDEVNMTRDPSTRSSVTNLSFSSNMDEL